MTTEASGQAESVYESRYRRINRSIGCLASVVLVGMLLWTGFLYVVLIGGYGGYDLPDAEERAWRELLQSIPWTARVGLTAFLVIAGIIILIYHIPKREHRVSGCANCGYDLSGLPSGQCPECGETFSMSDRDGGSRDAESSS